MSIINLKNAVNKIKGMKESKEIIIKSQFIDSINSLDLYERDITDFLSDEERKILETVDIRIVEDEKSRWIYPDSEHISIDSLINNLNTLKNDGATHVCVDYQYDNHEYEIYGYKMTRASEDYIKSIEDAKKAEERKKKENRIIFLENEIKRLKEEDGEE